MPPKLTLVNLLAGNFYLLMNRVLSAPPAELFKLNFTLHFFLILVHIVIPPGANRALQSY